MASKGGKKEKRTRENRSGILSATRSQMEIRTKEKLVRTAIAPNTVSRTSTPLLVNENQVSLLRIHFSHPESDGKSSDIGRHRV